MQKQSFDICCCFIKWKGFFFFFFFFFSSSFLLQIFIQKGWIQQKWCSTDLLTILARKKITYTKIFERVLGSFHIYMAMIWMMKTFESISNLIEFTLWMFFEWPWKIVATNHIWTINVLSLFLKKNNSGDMLPTYRPAYWNDIVLDNCWSTCTKHAKSVHLLQIVLILINHECYRTWKWTTYTWLL